MYELLFHDFAQSDDTLRVYRGERLVFASNKDRLLPLLEYIDRLGRNPQPVVLFDKIMGNAAALLAVIAHCQEIYSPLGSQLAARTLERHGIEYHFTLTVPYIQKPDLTMCPMEQLSLNKEPAEFYALLKKRAGASS